MMRHRDPTSATGDRAGVGANGSVARGRDGTHTDRPERGPDRRPTGIAAAGWQ
ncbi:hypothetical protein [Halococcus agarilyticus]|uniref:hypothetical protein n=1 Tax=Halococcus agarilyticus TaxID=1232219 RepID=UPI0012AC2908|nr:hypothetical protein [Halococcus agarilyticus]